MNATPEQARAVLEDLRAEAAAQPSNRKGTRAAIELYRAAATVNRIYGLEDSPT